MKTANEFIAEVQQNGVRPTARFGYTNLGRAVPKEAKHIGTMGNGEEVHHLQKGLKAHHYFVSNPDTKRVNAHLITHEQEKKNVEKVEYLTANKQSKGAHHLYRHLVLKHNKVLSSDSQSEGARKVWDKAARHPGVHVHGFDKYGGKNTRNGKAGEAFHMKPSEDEHYAHHTEYTKLADASKDIDKGKDVKSPSSLDKDRDNLKKEYDDHNRNERTLVVMHKLIRDKKKVPAKKKVVAEGRAPVAGKVSPLNGADGNQRGWTSTDKWGHKKFWGKDFEASAKKHAGLTEEVDPVPVDEMCSKKALPKKKVAKEQPMTEATDSFSANVDKYTTGLKKTSAIAHPRNFHSGQPVHNMKHVAVDHTHQQLFDHLKKHGFKKTTGYDPHPDMWDSNRNNDTMVTTTSPVHNAKERLSAHVRHEHGEKPKLVFTKWPDKTNEELEQDVAEATTVADPGTSNEYRTTRFIHKGKHVASIKTYRGRAGGWISQVDNPDGSSAHAKYGIGPMDYTKAAVLKKIHAYHAKEVNEGSYHIHIQNEKGVDHGKVRIWAMDQKHAEDRAGGIIGKKPYRGMSVTKVTKIDEDLIEAKERIREIGTLGPQSVWKHPTHGQLVGSNLVNKDAAERRAAKYREKYPQHKFDTVCTRKNGLVHSVRLLTPLK